MLGHIFVGRVIRTGVQRIGPVVPQTKGRKVLSDLLPLADHLYRLRYSPAYRHPFRRITSRVGLRSAAVSRAGAGTEKCEQHHKGDENRHQSFRIHKSTSIIVFQNTQLCS